MRTTALFAIILPLSALALASCSATRPAPMNTENAVVHQATDTDKAFTHSKEPLSGTSVTLWVNGLGCPQCASNVDMQMKRMKSVVAVRTDLSTGKVHLTLTGKGNPSPHILSERTLDAGFTLVKIEQP